MSDRLAARRWSAAARFEQRIAAGPRLFAIGYLVQRVVDYRRWKRADGARARAGVGFAGYLRLNWGLLSLRDLPAQIVRRGWRSTTADIARLTGRLKAQRPGARNSSSRA